MKRGRPEIPFRESGYDILRTVLRTLEKVPEQVYYKGLCSLIRSSSEDEIGKQEAFNLLYENKPSNAYDFDRLWFPPTPDGTELRIHLLKKILENGKER